MSEQKRFWALEVIASFFPDFDHWLRRLAAPETFMSEAQGQFNKIPRWAIEKACSVLLKSASVPHRRLPFLIAQEAERIYKAHNERRWRGLTDGQTVVACIVCNDTGLVTVLDPLTVEEIRTKKAPPRAYYVSSVLCFCQAGRRLGEIWKRSKTYVVTYDHERHIIADEIGGTEHQYKALMAEYGIDWGNE